MCGSVVALSLSFIICPKKHLGSHPCHTAVEWAGHSASVIYWIVPKSIKRAQSSLEIFYFSLQVGEVFFKVLEFVGRLLGAPRFGVLLLCQTPRLRPIADLATCRIQTRAPHAIMKTSSKAGQTWLSWKMLETHTYQCPAVTQTMFVYKGNLITFLLW